MNPANFLAKKCRIFFSGIPHPPKSKVAVSDKPFILFNSCFLSLNFYSLQTPVLTQNYMFLK